MLGKGKFVEIGDYRIWVYDDNDNIVYDKKEHQKYINNRINFIKEKGNVINIKTGE